MDRKKFEEVVVNITAIIDRYNGQIHHLENLLRSQVKIINELQKQITYLKKDKTTLTAPPDAKCVCCTISASIIAKCGHYFCDICVGRFHHEDCIQCEKNRIIGDE